MTNLKVIAVRSNSYIFLSDIINYKIINMFIFIFAKLTSIY